MLRKAVVFYLSLNNIFEITNSSFDKIKTINHKNVKKELIPVLKKGEIFNLEETQKNVIELLEGLLILADKEKLYLSEFSKGNYNPSLLFDECTASNVKKHPMAKWRVANHTR